MTALWFWAVDPPVHEPEREPVERVLRYPATPQTLAIAKVLKADEERWSHQQRVSDAELVKARRVLDRRARDEYRLQQLQLRQLERQEQLERQKQLEQQSQATKQEPEQTNKQKARRGTKPQYPVDQIKVEIRKRHQPTAPEMVEWCTAQNLKAPSDRQMARYIANVAKEKTEQQT